MPRRELVLTDVERRVALRQLGGFEQVGEEALAAITALSRREQFAPGSIISKPGELGGSIPLLLDGDLQILRNGRRWPHPNELRAFGLLWLARDRAPLEVTTAGGADLLELPYEGMEELLHEQFPVALTILRDLASQLTSTSHEVRAQGRHTTLTGRVEALADTLAFARDHVDALLQLESESEPVRFSSGDTLWRPGESADHLLVLLDGALSGMSWLDVLAQTGRSTRARALEDSIALRVGEESLIDMLEDHHALTRELIATLARSVIAIVEKG